MPKKFVSRNPLFITAIFQSAPTGFRRDKIGGFAIRPKFWPNQHPAIVLKLRKAGRKRRQFSEFDFQLFIIRRMLINVNEDFHGLRREFRLLMREHKFFSLPLHFIAEREILQGRSKAPHILIRRCLYELENRNVP